jgi:3-hydroxyanthranilate 3,4-dioxygenase
MNSAFNLQEWIERHRPLLKPPVGNKCMVDGDFIVMIVGGPNARTDFHLEAGPELFYQLEGEMVLKTQRDGRCVDVPIKAGEMFYLEPWVPHSPQRMANSVGLVVERKRRPDELDGLQWYCQQCNHLLYDERFVLRDIEKDFFAVFDRFYRDQQLQSCQRCGHVHEVPTRFRADSISKSLG